MTDGRDENNPGTGPGSVRQFKDVAELIKETGALMFGIGLGVNVDQDPLEQIAELSGGRAFFPSDVTELPAQYRRVVDDLRRRYVVGYTSSHIQHDGSWRTWRSESRTCQRQRYAVRTVTWRRHRNSNRLFSTDPMDFL